MESPLLEQVKTRELWCFLTPVGLLFFRVNVAVYEDAF